MASVKKTVDKFEIFQDLVENFEQNLFVERGLNVLIKIEGLVKSIKARVGRALNNQEIDIVLNATLRALNAKEPLNFGEYIKEGKDTISSMIDYIIDKIEKVSNEEIGLEEMLEKLKITLVNVNYQIVKTQEMERPIVLEERKFEKKN